MLGFEVPMDEHDEHGKKVVRAKEGQAPPAAPWTDLTGVHAFLIEDNADTRTMVSEVLAYCGAMVTVYQSADEAIADVAEFVPNVFICDLSMPGLDGLGFLRRMRSLPVERGGTIPAIAITAYYEEFAAATALEAGYNAYMTKPIKLDELCRLVGELARGSSPAP
jgi:CheY-like chemotaxis protein